MEKYLQILTGEGLHNVPVGDGLFVEQTGALALRLYSANTFSHHYLLTTVGGTVALADALEAACIRAAATNWQNAVVPVSLPTGETVASIRMTVYS